MVVLSYTEHDTPMNFNNNTILGFIFTATGLTIRSQCRSSTDSRKYPQTNRKYDVFLAINVIFLILVGWFETEESSQ